jgi:hypothetical protein
MARVAGKYGSFGDGGISVYMRPSSDQLSGSKNSPSSDALVSLMLSMESLSECKSW